MLSLPRQSIVFVSAIVMALAVSAVSPNTNSASETIVVGQQTQVLVDDHVIDSMRGLVRRLNLLAKHPGNPILSPERPWEENFAVPLSVMFDDEQKRYRMWYRPGYSKFNLGYITSADGIHWDRPSLGLVDYKGSRDNSQIALKTGPAWNGVVKDVRDPDPDRRYKLLAYNRATESNGLYLFRVAGWTDVEAALGQGAARRIGRLPHAHGLGREHPAVRRLCPTGQSGANDRSNDQRRPHSMDPLAIGARTG